MEYADYQKNPGKYRLFKTAKTRCNVINQDGGINEGTYVSIQFYGERFNPLYKRMEPVYLLDSGDVLYANALTNFGL